MMGRSLTLCRFNVTISKGFAREIDQLTETLIEVGVVRATTYHRHGCECDLR
jgi:hypothetical protein